MVDYEVVEAVNTLVDKGFNVEEEYKYVASDSIAEGKVVKTSPEIGTLRKEGTTITIFLSSGEGKYLVEDVVGQNYLEAKGKIEAGCNCNVLIEKEKVDEKSKDKVDTVLKTVPAAGESIKMGEQITIVIPDVEYKYPDFTKGYTYGKVEEYCNDHNIKLETKYQENSSKPAGTILAQSRAAGSVVTPGATLVITLSTVPESDDAPSDDSGNEQAD